jgi:hypothetical protein
MGFRIHHSRSEVTLRLTIAIGAVGIEIWSHRSELHQRFIVTTLLVGLATIEERQRQYRCTHDEKKTNVLGFIIHMHYFFVAAACI